MFQLNLSPEEHELVVEILQGYLATLTVEINHTDHAEFKLRLKQRRVLASRLLERLEMTTATA